MITLTEQDAEWLRFVAGRWLGKEALSRAHQLLTHGSEPPADPDVITDPCRCNQLDSQRDRRHQRGDLRVCRDAIDHQEVPSGA